MTSRSKGFVLSLVSLTTAVSAHAAGGFTLDQDEIPASRVESRPRGSDFAQEILIGGSYRNFDYVEYDDTSSHLDGEMGNMPGVNLGYRGDFRRFFVGADLTVVSSHTTYHGSNQAGTVAVDNRTKTGLIEIEGDVGMPFLESESFAIKGYSGLGFHSWRRGETGVANGVAVLREDYSWLVLPVGVRFEASLADAVKLSFDASARLSSNGSLDIKFSEYDDSLEDAHVDLGAKIGYRFQLPFEIALARSVSLVTTPWYEYSAIGESNTTEVKLADGSGTGNFILEPSSHTKQAGITLQVGVLF